MPNRKLTDLPTLNIAQFTSNDLLYIVDAGASDADASKKITYANLVGNDIIRIDSGVASFSAENVGDITFLSGGVDANTVLIDALSLDATAATTSINAISTVIDTNFAFFQVLSADVDDINLAGVTSDVATLCTYTDFFKAEIGDGLYDVKYAALTAYTYVTRVSALDLTLSGNKIGSANLATTANTLATAVNELHSEVNTNTAAIATSGNAINARIPLATLKTEVAASADFAAFKLRIAAL